MIVTLWQSDFSIYRLKYESLVAEFTSTEYKSANGWEQHKICEVPNERTCRRSNLRITVASRKKVVRSLIRYFAYILFFFFLHSFFFSGPESDTPYFLRRSIVSATVRACETSRSRSHERKEGRRARGR